MIRRFYLFLTYQVRICPDSPCFYESVGKKGSHFAAIVNVVGRIDNSSIATIRISFKTKEDGTLWHLSLEKAKAFISRQATSGDMQSLISLSLRLKAGITVRDRFYYLTVYSRCFVGTEAVSWIQKDQHCSEAEAVELGNRLLNVNLIYHCQHNRFFLNSHTYYRFNKHTLRDIVEGLRAPMGIIPDLSSRNSLRFTSSSSHVAEEPCEGDQTHLKSEMADTEAEDEVSSESILRGSDPTQISSDALQLELLSLRSSLEVATRLKNAHNSLLTEFSNLKELQVEHLSTIRSLKFCAGGVFLIFLLHLLLRELLSCSLLVILSFHFASLIVFLFFYISPLLEPNTVPGFDDVGDHHDKFPLLFPETFASPSLERAEEIDLDIFSFPPPQSWPNRPLLVRRSPSMYLGEASKVEELEPMERSRLHGLTRPIRIHTADPEVSVIDIDSDIFSGKMYTIFAGLKDSPRRFFR
jgi:hypothetical protein